MIVVVGLVVYYRFALLTDRQKSDISKEQTKKDSSRSVKNKELGYTISIPDGMIEENNGRLSRLYVRKAEQPGAGPTNFIYISVVPKGMEGAEGEIYNYNRRDIQRLKSLSVDQVTNLTETNDQEIAKYYEYERSEDRMLGGFGATSFVNKMPWEFPAGVVEHRFIVPFEQATYLVGYYIGGDKTSPYYLDQDQAESILNTLKINPSDIAVIPTPTPDKNWIKFENIQYGISFEHPSSWEKRVGGQSFENGDLVAFQVIGQTQRPQTELYDGLSFAVMNPIETDVTAEEWAKKTYGTVSEVDPENPPQYSAVSYGGERYEKIVVSGLGKFTYYHIKKNGKIYGFMLMAAGPSEDSYNEAVSRVLSSVKYL